MFTITEIKQFAELKNQTLEFSSDYSDVDFQMYKEGFYKKEDLQDKEFKIGVQVSKTYYVWFDISSYDLSKNIELINTINELIKNGEKLKVIDLIESALPFKKYFADNAYSMSTGKTERKTNELII